MPLKTCPSPQLLQRFVDGRCSKSEREDLAHHVQSCSSCSQKVEQLHGKAPGSVFERGGSIVFGNSIEGDTVRDAVSDQPTAQRDTQEAPVKFVDSDPGAPPDAAPEPFSFLAASSKPGELGRLGPYAVLKMLGEGGMGVVFQARDTKLDRLLALKVLRPEQAANEHARRRFLQEAKIVAALQHDNIITIYQVGEERGLPFFAMQLLQGTPLDRLLKEKGRLPTPDVVRIGRQVAEGLAVAHERNLIHRDIKPGNVWLEHAPGQTNYRVKILDFGLARNVTNDGQHLTRTGVIMGTPGYMAPEQARSTGADHRCDLFSLGCVLYHMLAGREPFRGDDVMAVLMQLALENPPPITDFNPDAPYFLTHLIERMMAKNPDDRPATAAEVASILATAQQTVARGSGQSHMLDEVAPAAEEILPPRTGSASKPPPASRAPSTLPPEKSAPVVREAPPTASKPVMPSAAPKAAARPAPPAAELQPTLEIQPADDDLTGPCPRCGAPRTSSAGHGWCLACGYHPQLKAQEVVEEPEPQPPPVWPWVLGFGVFVIVAVSVGAHFLLRRDSLPRAHWGAGQLAIGLVFLVVAQIWAWLYVFNKDQEASLFAPIKTWIAVIKTLPATRKPLYLGSWSLSAILCAVLIVGGQTYWLDHMKKRPPRAGGPNTLTLRRAGPSAKDFEQSMQDYTNIVETAEAAVDLSPKSENAGYDTDDNRTPFGAQRVHQSFTVVGYTGRAEAFFSLALAQEVPGGNFVYVGMVYRGFFPSEREPIRKLARIDRAPEGATGVNATWVEPKLVCDVEYAFVDQQGLIRDASFRNWK